jgi:hypothetical protein
LAEGSIDTSEEGAMTAPRVALLMTALALAAPWSAKWTGGALANAGEPAGSLSIRIVPRKGPAHIETLDGIGCTEAVCSRVFVRTLVVNDEGAAVQNFNFDTIAAIEMLGGGDARVRLIDGTFQPVLVAADNRLLYLRDDAGRTKKVDLGGLAAIEFLR